MLKFEWKTPRLGRPHVFVLSVPLISCKMADTYVALPPPLSDTWHPPYNSSRRRLIYVCGATPYSASVMFAASRSPTGLRTAQYYSATMHHPMGHSRASLARCVRYSQHHVVNLFVRGSASVHGTGIFPCIHRRLKYMSRTLVHVVLCCVVFSECRSKLAAQHTWPNSQSHLLSTLTGTVLDRRLDCPTMSPRAFFTSSGSR